MRHGLKVLFASACGVLLFASVGFADEETTENELYKQWAKFKPGSYSVMKMTSDVAGTKTETIVRQTLKELTKEKAVVEYQSKTMMAGQEFEMPAHTEEIPATYKKAEVEAPEQEEQKEPDVKTTEGEEEIEVAGKKVKTKWVESVSKQEGMVIKSKVWMCDDVPGQSVKTLTIMEGPEGMRSEAVVTEFKAM